VKEGEARPPAITVRVCETLSCRMAGAESLMASLARLGMKDVRVVGAPCVGRCESAPVVVVGRNPIVNATVDAVRGAVSAKHVEAAPAQAIDYAAYRRDGGYTTLVECVSGTRTPESAIAELESSGMRGLGGAGFPAGRKWKIVRAEPAPRLMAINIDEGEPGTFKDRWYLERDPHRFLEGMLIAAWAVGIDAIYVYLRDEYAACRALLEREIRRSSATPPLRAAAIDLRRGATAYICGEESAMIESIEGKRGSAAAPLLVAQVGLFGRPTLSTLETLYWIATSSRRAARGSRARAPRAQGLRSFSVSGRVRSPACTRAGGHTCAS
jgi:formate dehydrogenase